MNMSNHILEFSRISRFLRPKRTLLSITFARKFYDDKDIGIETRIDGRIVEYRENDDSDDDIVRARSKKLMESGDRILSSDVQNLISAAKHKNDGTIFAAEEMFKRFCVQQRIGGEEFEKASYLAAELIKLCRRSNEPEVARRILSSVRNPTHLAQISTMDLLYKHKEYRKVLELAQNMMTTKALNKESFLLLSASAYKMGCKETLALVEKGFVSAGQKVSAHGAGFAAALAMKDNDFGKAEFFLTEQTQSCGIISNLRISTLLHLRQTDDAFRFFRNRAHEFFLTGRIGTKFCGEIVKELDAALSRDSKSQLELFRRTYAKLEDLGALAQETLEQLINRTLERNWKTDFIVENKELLRSHQVDASQIDHFGSLPHSEYSGAPAEDIEVLLRSGNLLRTRQILEYIQITSGKIRDFDRTFHMLGARQDWPAQMSTRQRKFLAVFLVSDEALEKLNKTIGIEYDAEFWAAFFTSLYKFSSDVIHGNPPLEEVLLDEEILNFIWPHLGKVLVEFYKALETDFQKYITGYKPKNVPKFTEKGG